MGSPARSDSVADCGGSDHAPCPPLSQPLQRGIGDRPRQSAALGTCSCQGVLSWAVWVGCFPWSPGVAFGLRVQQAELRWMHIVACSDCAGCLEGRGAVLRGILFLHRQIGEKKQAKRWRSAPKINLSKTDVRTGLVGLKVDGGGGRVSRCWGQQTQSGRSPKLRL